MLVLDRGLMLKMVTVEIIMTESIENRLAERGLSIKGKPGSTPMSEQSRTSLEATAKNPCCKDATRLAALDELDRRDKKAKTKA